MQLSAIFWIEPDQRQSVAENGTGFASPNGKNLGGDAPCRCACERCYG